MTTHAVRIAVGLRLGLHHCQTDLYVCVAPPSIRADCTVCLANEILSGRATRHQQLNDLVYRALRRADVLAGKKPAGLTRIDGKRPDGLTLIPWEEGRSLTWDVTVHG
jgi:hypothetical protein